MDFARLTMKLKKILFTALPVFMILFLAWQWLQHVGKEIAKDAVVTDFVEIEGYQGENFSSLNDFRENSIKGPQYIDINQYSLAITGLVKESQDLSYDQVLAYPAYKKGRY